MVAGACADSATKDDGPCPGGVPVSYDGVDYCVIAAPIIETGFSCPPTFPHSAAGPGFVICGPQDGLSDVDANVVGAIGGSGCYAPLLDVVVVVDNSSSMCGEQTTLAGKLERLALQLQALHGDVHFAVTTPDMQCEVDGTSIFSAGGVFNTTPATAYPPPCQLRYVSSCFSDAECMAAFGDDGGEWTCRHANTEACGTNPNGSVNSECIRQCTEDAECVTATGDPRAVCQKPSPNASDWGCVVPPPEASCPPEVASGQRAWLATNELDAAACLTTVGVNQEKCFKYEQGLGAAWAALDPVGPNAIQSQDFLRTDANLLLVFVSDEDDCTVADGQTVSENDYDTCALLGDTTAGGPLVAVDELVARFRGLKPDRAIIVGAISGDSLAATPSEVDAARAAYVASKTDPKVCFHQTSICDSELGRADYGARYFAFAAAFGDDGVVANLCAPDPFEAFLADLVTRVTQIPPTICHPK
ncbi:MAG: hypothetical protein CVU56_21620 [Deltaproteobacteria bacterium HGW-Deltaproteobacteria-14]|jgi:hypothetical protein|nr:MAG: hypothetical protein CVU56_21620 [Deltaproteobacteria bacterium HGW-Deltaproteobacteria-14]